MARPDFFDALPEPIASERLVLRAPESRDVPVMSKLANNRKIHERLARLPHPYTEADGQQFVDNMARSETEHAYAITLKTGEFIGVVGLHLECDTSEIGYWLGEPFWGQGFATEAVTILIDRSANAGAKIIRSRALSSNKASCHVLEKSGFHRVEERLGDCGPNKNVLMSYFIWEDEK